MGKMDRIPRRSRGRAVKFFPLVWAGIWRKRSRSILILAQVIIAFTLFGVLQGLSSAVQHVLDSTHGDRLYVSNRLRFGFPLPISLVERLRTTAGVASATYQFRFGGTYQRADQQVPVAATDIESYLPMFPELRLQQAQAVQAMKQAQDGVIVGTETMSKYGWRVGQRITLQTPLPQKNGSRDWTFEIVGSYEDTELPDQAVLLVANYRYVNESLAGQADTITFANVHIADPRQAGSVGEAIDRQFANSPNETLTQSERDLAESQVENIGDLDVAVHRITAVTFFVLLFATGALMMQSIRERTPELAVLKTFGFSDVRVMVLILCETLVLCVAGAALGLWIATVILRFARSLLQVGSMSLIVVVIGFACAVVLALAGGAIPAWRGLRLRVVDALAGR
jgi:putative ABC transport system permease protein